MHEYKAENIRNCLKSKRVVYIGDSTARQIFWATAKKLDPVVAENALRIAEKHRDLSFTSAGVGLEFIWDPFLNSTTLHDELLAYHDVPKAANDGTSNGNDSAALILVGAGLWHARHVEVNPLKAFKDAIDNIVPFMTHVDSATAARTASEPLLQRRGTSNLLLLAPVQVPLYESLSPSRAASIAPEKIEGMNEYLRGLSAYQGADVIWSYSRMTWQEKLAYEESGLHVVENVAGRKADLVLNLRCNAEAALFLGYPFNRTCCSNYRRLGWVQWAVLVCGLGLSPLVVLLRSRGRRDQCQARSSVLMVKLDYRRTFPLPSSGHSRALLTFFLAVCYCFYADRTQIFNKYQKYYSQRDFIAFCLAVLALGVLSIRRSILPARLESTEGVHQRVMDQPFLPRDQTEEWKGWMQFIILIYHYTGASKVPGIYEAVRLMVAAYLFMTGFGHAVFFYKKGDYSLRRTASVLVRLNLLSCVLPYVMRTDYLFYYFAPLVSFWFMVIYFTMRIGHSRNYNTAFLFSKIVASATLVNALIRVPGILEAIFLILRKTCRIHWDVTEWRFRILLDIFVVYFGMVSGILYVKISTQSSERHRPKVAFNTLQQHPFSVQVFFTILALALSLIFWALTRHSADKYEYNRWQPYVSCFPILSFVILRNLHRHLRNFHSSIFAWLGRCCLETFTLQFHTWLAGDTKGLLSTGLFGRAGMSSSGRREDFVLVTAIFLWMSWCVAHATTVLTDWIIDPSEGEPGKQSSEDGELRRGCFRLPPFGTRIALPSRNETYPAKATLASFVRHFRENLTMRLGVLLAIMWFANIVSVFTVRIRREYD